MSLSKRDYLYLSGSFQLQNVSTVKEPESNTISNSGIGDVNLKIKDGEKDKLCPLIPPGKIWNAKIQYYSYINFMLFISHVINDTCTTFRASWSDQCCFKARAGA